MDKTKDEPICKEGKVVHDKFIAGAQWQAKQSPWIRVEDRLPDTDNGQSLYEVFVKMNDGRYYVVVNIDVENMAEIGEVTQWMSIPE